MERASFIEEHCDTVDGDAFKRILGSNTTTVMQLSIVSCKGLGSISEQENVVGDNIVNGKLEKSCSGDPNGVSSSKNISIREYVSTVRAKDIRKTWPFSQDYLQKCLDNNRQPFLPPLESPFSGKDSFQEKLSGKENLVQRCDTLKTNAVSQCLNKDKIEDPNHSEKKAIVRKGVGKRKQKNRRKKKKLVPRKTRQRQSSLGTSKECIVLQDIVDLEESTQLKEDPKEEKELSRITRKNEDKHQETEAELMIPCRSGGKDCVPGRDTACFIESTTAQCETRQAICELMYKKEDNQLELGDIQINEPGETKGNKILACEIKSQEGNKKEHTLEKTKAEAGKNEEFGNSGSLPEAMIPKVCPVCRSFSSTSNIALNAHIDHCLSAESNTKKTGTKVAKPKVKVRKKRSMADIIAAALTCTLEDLDYSTSKEQWTTDAHPLPLDHLDFKDTSKRKQHQCQDPNVHVYRKGKKLRVLSNLKEDCQTDSREDCEKKKRSAFDENNEEVFPKKRKIVASNSNQCLKGDAISLKRLKNKVQAASATKHYLSKDTGKGKSTSLLLEALHEDGLPRSGSGSAQACSSGQESIKADTSQEKLVDFKQVGEEKASSKNNDEGLTDVLETVASNHLEAELHRSPAKSTSPPGSREDDIHMTTSGITNNARTAVEISKIDCSPLVEVSDGFTCKRKKHISKCRMKPIALRHESSICNTNSASLEVCQEEEGICDEDKVIQNCVMVSSDDSLGNALEPPIPKSSSVSKTQEYDAWLSSDRKESSVKCLLSSSQLKEQEQSSSMDLLEKSSTSERPNTLSSEARALQSKENITNDIDNSNAQKQQARPFSHDISSDGTENSAANIIQDMRILKDGSKDVIEKKAKSLELDAQSLRTVHDVGLISNHDDIAIKIDSETKGVKFKLYSNHDASAFKEASNLNANSGGQLPTESLKVSEGVNAQFAGPVRETQAQMNSTTSHFNQNLQATTCEVPLDRHLQSRKSGNSPAQLDCGARDSLGALSRTSAHILGISVEGPSNGVAHVQSLSRGNDMNSSSLKVPESIKTTETVQKKVAPQKNSGTQYCSIADVSKEKVQFISQQKQTLRQNLSTQNMSDSMEDCAIILNPSNRQVNAVARDPTATKTVNRESNFHASRNKYLYSRPSVQPSKSHWGPLVSQGNIAVNSLDSMRVTSVANNSLSTNRLAAESGHSQPRNMKENPQATAQKFVNFAGGVFGHSVCSSYCTSSIDPPLTSQRDSVQEGPVQSETSQFVNNQCSFGNSMRFTSVTVPQVVSPALFAGQLGEGRTAEGLSYGCITIQDHPNPCNFQSNPSAIQRQAHSSSICPSQKQNGSNQTSNNSLFGITNGSYGGNLVVGVPSCAYTVQNDAPALSSSNANGRSCTSGSFTTSELYQGAYRKQHSVTNTSHSSGLITAQGHSDTSDLNTIDCCGESALFGNPILRLMGKNLMVANKDGGKPKQLDKVPTSMEEYPNANYLRLLGFTSEETFWQDGNSYLYQPLESSITFDQNPFHTPEGLRRRDSRSLGDCNDSSYQPPTAAGNMSDVWTRRLAGSSPQSSAGANSVNIGPAGSHLGFTSSTIKYTLSHISSTTMEKEILYRPVGPNYQAKKKPPSSAPSQSAHEVIIIDDSPDEGPVPPIQILEPTSFSGKSNQLQEGHSTPRISKANSKFRSGKTILQPTPSYFSALTESSVACGSNLPNAGMYRQN